MKKVIIVISVLSISALLVVGFLSIILFKSNARYTNYQEFNHLYESSKFYFSSNNLDSENKYNVINYYDFNNITFNLKNSLNEEQISQYDLEYEITCEVKDEANEYYKCLIDDKDNNVLKSELKKKITCVEDINLTEEECTEQKYTKKLTENIKEHTFKLEKIKDNYELDNVTVSLKATTKKPFTYLLEGTYILNLNTNIKDTILINNLNDTKSSCEYLISNTYKENKIIKLNINTTNLIIDETSKIYLDKIASTTNVDNYINSITFNLNTNNSLKINLYKKDFDSECTTTNLTYELVE